MRDRRGRSPAEAVDALLAALQNADAAGSVWDDSGMVAAHLGALGGLAPASPEVCQVVSMHDLRGEGLSPGSVPD